MLYSGNVREERENRLRDDILATPNSPPGELISSHVPTSKASATTTETTATTIRATETTTSSCKKHRVVNSTSTSVSTCTDGKPGNAVIGKLFNDTQQVHSKYTCQPNCQKSPDDQLVWMKGKARKAFQHDWLLQSKWFDEQTKFWWLIYVENEGMYCLLCKKHGSRDDSWAGIPCKKLVVDAIKDHGDSKKHDQCRKAELLSRSSTFQRDLDRREEVEIFLIQKAFQVIYWMMKEEIANVKFEGLLQLTERLGVSDMRLFGHRSHPSVQEMMLEIGKAVLESVLPQTANAYGVLIDEVKDITVVEQLITFVKYVNGNGEAKTVFLGAQELDSPQGPNAESITKKLPDLLADCKLPTNLMSSFVSDGASVMTGKKSGVAARLKNLQPTLISFHCICHNLALANSDADHSLKPIKNAVTNLTTAWKFFENSPKRTAIFIHMQKELRQLELTEKNTKKLSRKIRKACRTRWLSINQSVESVLHNYLPMVNTFKALEDDPLALGLLKKFHCTRMLGMLYILHTVLPVMSNLSKLFQTNALSYSVLKPSIQAAKSRLTDLADPVDDLTKDLAAGGKFAQAELTVTDADKTFLSGMFNKYTKSLTENIDDRFSGALGILEAFHVFNPLTVPAVDSPGFKVYGDDEVKKIATHFYPKDKEASQQLKDEWQNFKHNLLTMKGMMPKNVKDGSSTQTPIDWMLTKVLSERHTYENFFPVITKLADVIHSAPITNASPERGASALKRIKTKSRNRLSQKMLNAHLQVSINGPEPGTREALEVINKAKEMWVSAKPRRKLPKKVVSVLQYRPKVMQAIIAEYRALFSRFIADKSAKYPAKR